MQSRWAMAAAMACVLAGGAAADEIVMKNKVTYPGIAIVEVQAGNIVYKLGQGIHRKPLVDVASIRLDDRGVEFNKAEKLAAAGKAAEAVDAYDKAAKDFTADDWQMNLIRYRRMAAANTAGKISTSVADWLAMIEESKASRMVLGMRPTNLGKRGSADVNEAIELLTAKLEDMKAGEGRVTVGKLLVDLHLLQGNQAKADEVRKALGAGLVTANPTTSGTAGTPTTDNPPPDDVPISSGGPATLSGPAEDVRARRYAAAIQTIQSNLNRYGESELPKALLLLGKAQFLIADTAGEKRVQTLRQAGLNFMRANTAAAGGSTDAAEALYMAARVCLELGNMTAGQNALRDVVANFKGEWADKAKAALDRWGTGPASRPAAGPASGPTAGPAEE